MFVNLLVLSQDTLVSTYQIGFGTNHIGTLPKREQCIMLFSFEQQRTYTQLFHMFQMTIPPSLSLILISNRVSLKIIYGLAFHQRCQCLIQASLTKSNKEEGNFLEYVNWIWSVYCDWKTYWHPGLWLNARPNMIFRLTLIYVRTFSVFFL